MIQGKAEALIFSTDLNNAVRIEFGSLEGYMNRAINVIGGRFQGSLYVRWSGSYVRIIFIGEAVHTEYILGPQFQEADEYTAQGQSINIGRANVEAPMPHTGRSQSRR